MEVCAPVSGNWVRLWSNLAPFHCDVVWQITQSCGKPAATWFGLAVPLKSARWQETHVLKVPWNTLFLWQSAHAAERCAPVSGNFVAVLWSNFAPFHWVIVWQIEQSCGKPAAT